KLIVALGKPSRLYDAYELKRAIPAYLAETLYYAK
uniref:CAPACITATION inhibitory protein D (Fragments) n=1 Tax=Oryctolagus cuniculus TaxID=9986 RepID=Q9TS91_RABIT